MPDNNNVHTIGEMTEKEWLEWRRLGIGGSDAAAIMGLSPFKSALEVWCSKMLRYGKYLSNLDGLSDIAMAYSETCSDLSLEERVIMDIGTALEPLIIKNYIDKTGRNVISGKDAVYRTVHPKHEFMIATIDGKILNNTCELHDGPGVLEVKTRGAYVDWKGENVPIYYMIQLQHYLKVTGFSWGSFVILDLGSRKIRWFDVERNDELISTIVSEEKKFWDMVLNKTPPEPDESKSCQNFIRECYTEHKEGKIIDLTNNYIAEQHVTAFRDAKGKQKSLNKVIDSAKSNLMLMMGDAEKAAGDGFNITWKAPFKPKRTCDFDKLKKDHPNVYKNYVDETDQIRRFTIR